MYVIFWEFVVRPEKVDAYGSEGPWAQLFAQAEGYLGTELLRSIEGEGRAQFVTIDRWQSSEHFTQFRTQFDTQYRTLDTQCDGMTLKERKLGTFVSEV
jgi:heme-degrading monooxygenase HmoA